jgi:hypothetical protein
MWLGVVAIASGCASEAPRSEDPIRRLDLRLALGDANVDPVGVAIGANGERFVFDEQRGLYQVTGDTAVPVVSMHELPVTTVPLQLPFTDLAAISPGVFALTAIGDGFLLDTTAMTLTQHFCYLPDGTPSDLMQRTDAIAFDPATDRIYAQPVTTTTDGMFQYAQMAGYERATGNDLAWYAAPDSLAATGMAIVPEHGLVVGQGSRLAQFDVATSQTSQLADLTAFGVRSIDGLAVDAAAGTLLIVDRETDELVEIELSVLAD